MHGAKIIGVAAVLAGLAAPSAQAQSYANAYVTFAAVDAWDPVVLLDIGNRQSNQTNRGIVSGSTAVVDALGDQTLYARASASVGALHVESITAFGPLAAAGDTRSANFNAYANWSDDLTLHFAPQGATSGYAFVDLLVSGTTASTINTGAIANLPFTRTLAGFAVYAGNGIDRVDTGVVFLDNTNYFERHLDPTPGCSASQFDSYWGQCFTENAPVDWSIHQISENFSGYYPYVTSVTGTPVPVLAATYQIRVPFSTGLTTTLDVRAQCESYAGADYGDTAEAFCDLGQSIYWGGIDHVTDIDGNWLSGWSVGSASGFDYAQSYFDQPPAAAVPEPASWAMMIAGFAMVGGAARRRVAPSGGMAGIRRG